MNLLLDFDDLHWTNPENCLSTIDFLVAANPSIKLTMFTVPLLRGMPLDIDKDFCGRIKHYIQSENIQIGVHGLLHSEREFFHTSYDEAVNKLKIAEEIFNKCDLPFIKIFKGPHWGMNRESVSALIDFGYRAIFNHIDYKYLEVPGIEFIYYNWNLKDDLPITNTNLVGHGHTHNVCGNGIEERKYSILAASKIYNCIFYQDYDR